MKVSRKLGGSKNGNEQRSFEVKQTVHNLHNVCVYTGVGSLEVACAPHQADGSSSSSSEAPWLSDRTFNVTAAGDTLAILAILGPGLVLSNDPSVPQPVVQSRRRPLLGPSPG